MDDAWSQCRVRKFVAGRSAPIAQRRANACASFARQHVPRLTRLVNEVAGGKIGLDLASVISATQVNRRPSDQVFD
jgi:hypothetical protein